VGFGNQSNRASGTHLADVPDDEQRLGLAVLAHAAQEVAAVGELEEVERVVVVAEDREAASGGEVPETDEAERAGLA